ncbi:MAG: alpha-glucosidase [Anaerolineaceae bacterium]|jgi:alpha-glucosidase
MTKTRLWWRDGAIYQIYPRSFVDSNATGIGDLNGIISRLAYLQELGVEAIWLSPIYPSPDVDFGYDVSNYTAIDARFGTLADFDRLVVEAHRRGIRVVLDLVLNHTSDQHPWFTESRKSRENAFSDWYMWRDPRPGGKQPNNWQSVFGGSGWEYEPARRQYYFHMFYQQQPDLNWRNPKVRQAMLDVFQFWLERGVDGFRLDVFNVYFKHADFLDNPRKWGLRGFDRQRHLYDADQPEMIPLLREVRKLLDAYQERYVVGETFLSSPQVAARYTGADMLHASFNFEFMARRWHPKPFLRSIQRWEAALSPDAWPNYVLNNHDVRRSASRYGKGEDDERLKVAAALLLTQRGTPFLYYGEEIGMRDISLARSELKDPIGRRYWPIYKGRDGCRSPMQWDDSPHAGFSAGVPWLPVHPNYVQRNVAAQQANPSSLYHFYRRLLALRKQVPALVEGVFLPLTYDPRLVLGYLRQTVDQTVLVGLNFSGRPISLALGAELTRSNWTLLLSNQRDELDAKASSSLRLAPNEACILLRQ